jgi:hypothetical protein
MDEKLKEAFNEVTIEGILNEVAVKVGTYTKNGTVMPYIGGRVYIRVDLNDQIYIIPVEVFSNKYKNNGDANPGFDAIQNIVDNYTSVAASDISKADRVRVFKGRIKENIYPRKDGVMISSPRVSGNFIYQVKTSLKLLLLVILRMKLIMRVTKLVVLS